MSIKDLFPAPSRRPSTLSPAIWPGSTPELLNTLQVILQENHKKWHVYINEKGFHNHTIHHTLALWALGANKEIIEAAYKQDVLRQKPAFPSPEPITNDNFSNHLGDENFYNAYLLFFCNVLTQKDISSVLEEFVFSSKFNFGSKSDSGQHPEMLNRFLGGVMHPMIHAGHGVEFVVPGIIAEGLAQAAVHPAPNTVLIPLSIFPNDHVEQDLSQDAIKPEHTAASGGSTHALTILACIMKDPNMQVQEVAEEGHMFAFPLAFLENRGEALFRYANSWTLDVSDQKEVERKIEELQWMNVLIYAVAGFKDGKGCFSADFFYMHLVTTSIFLPSLVAYLSPASQEIFLRAYLAVCLSVYVARGAPKLDLNSFFTADIVSPNIYTKTVSSSTPRLPLPPSSPSITSSPNSWFPIAEQTMVHPDDHLCKLQRTLAHYSTLYGWKSAGIFSEGETKLPGAQKIDGTLFIRAAGLTSIRLGRDRGEEILSSYWDRDGFFQKHD